MIPMSNISDEGVMTVRNEACERLLAQRVEVKMRSKKVNEVVNRLHVAMPTPRDNKERPPFIPQAVLDRKKAMEVEGGKKKKLAVELEREMADDYYLDLRQHWDLKSEKDKEDVIPEIFLGKNVADYIDPGIMKVCSLWLSYYTYLWKDGVCYCLTFYHCGFRFDSWTLHHTAPFKACWNASQFGG